MNSKLEALLHSWEPRRPSPKVEAALFTREAAPPARRKERTDWAWSAPTLGFAASLALTLLTFFSTPLDGVKQAARNWPAAQEGDSNNNRNLWQRASFEWTKRDVSNSTTRSFSVSGTNFLNN